MDQERIGKFIKKLREENNLTQKELADKLGVTFQAVSKWENGKNVPDIAILKQMSEEFHMNIDEILEGKRNSKKNDSKIVYVIAALLGVALLVIGLISILNHNDDYEFKTISSKCADFKISGSAAYNKEKATIYISNVEFCGKEDNTVYKEITCDFYGDYKNTRTKISSCEKQKNKKLEDFLKEVNMKVDHFSSSCKNLTENNLSLEIQALTEDNKTITYKIPIKLSDSCK
jgi:transcriptional regulator with XRE-family HTH domain